MLDTTPPTADGVTRVDYDRQTSKDDKNPDHVKQAIDSLVDIDLSMRYDAVITDKSFEHTDEYLIDVFGAGFGSDSTMSGMLAYPSAPGARYEIDNRIKVRFLSNGTLLILPLEMPLDSGLGKVFSIVDSGNPGTMAWDYVRLTDPAPIGS